MSDDPYTLLGVSKTASDSEIRSAYRKLAKELHPDLNPGDKTAEERFKKISAAYSILGDKEQRARFDRGEIDASGAERPPEQPFYRHYADQGGARYHSSAGYEDFGDISDLFEEILRERGASGGGGGAGGRGGGGQGIRMRGQTLHYHLEVDFLDAVNGAKQRITMTDGKAIDLTIPAGTEDGATLRLKGKGGPGIGGGPDGDALIEISVRPHPIFAREGDDILLELPITLYEAVLGGKVEVPTIAGRVKMTIPKDRSSGTTLRLKGKGVKAAGRQAGDQRITLKVVVPDEVDPELEEMMTRWRESHPYDPRAEMGRKL